MPSDGTLQPKLFQYLLFFCFCNSWVSFSIFFKNYSLSLFCLSFYHPVSFFRLSHQHQVLTEQYRPQRWCGSQSFTRDRRWGWAGGIRTFGEREESQVHEYWKTSSHDSDMFPGQTLRSFWILDFKGSLSLANSASYFRSEFPCWIPWSSLNNLNDHLFYLFF